MSATMRKLLNMIRDCGTEYKGHTDEQIFAMLGSPNWEDASSEAWTGYVPYDLQPIWAEMSVENRLVAFLGATDARERVLDDPTRWDREDSWNQSDL
jgi:hypothetical protein